MGKSCTYIMTKKDKNNIDRESHLFKDLLKYTHNNREKTNHVYNIIEEPGFIDNRAKDLDLDELRQPSIANLINESDLSKYIDGKFYLKDLNNKYGFANENGKINFITDTYKNHENLNKKIDDFNSEKILSKYYKAVLTVKDGNIGVKIVKKSSKDKRAGSSFSTMVTNYKNNYEERQSAEKEYSFNLNKRIREILHNHGVAVGTIDKLDENLGASGVTDLSDGERLANGLIQLIKIANGAKGEEALPEEFAHLALAATSNNPLIQRLIKAIIDNNLAKDIMGKESFDWYAQQYNNDQSKLALEAAGQLVAKYLAHPERIIQDKIRLLAHRVFEAIKNFFKGISISEIEKARIEADKTCKQIARDLISGNYEFDIANIDKSLGKFYEINKILKKVNDLLQKVTSETEVKQIKLDKRLQSKEMLHNKDYNTFLNNKREFLYKIQQEADSGNFHEAFSSYIQHMQDELNQLLVELGDINDLDTIEDKFKLLRRVHMYCTSYRQITADINDIIDEDNSALTKQLRSSDDLIITKVAQVLNKLDSAVRNNTKSLFLEYIKPFVGEDAVIKFGKGKGKVMDPKEFLNHSDSDVTFWDRWLDSMSDSPDMLIKVYDRMFKECHEKGRLKAIDIMKDCIAAGQKLKDAGIKDFKWMFQTKNGKMTGYYIGAIDHERYWKDYNEFKKKLALKYGNSVDDGSIEFEESDRAKKREWAKWFSEHTDKDGKPNEQYYDKQYLELEKQAKNGDIQAKAKLEFYETMMAIKSQCDGYLPNGSTTLHNAVKITKDLVERVKSSKKPFKSIGDAIKSSFFETSSDADFSESASETDFDDRQIENLPVYYTKLRNKETVDDMSTDVVSTMIAYAAMACDCEQISHIMDAAEASKDLIRSTRKIQRTVNGKPSVTIIDGKKVEQTIQTSESNFMRMLEDHFRMQLYGQYSAQSGNVVVNGKDTGISKRKTVRTLMTLTSIADLALNLPAGINNLLNNNHQLIVEATAGRFFNIKDLAAGDLIFSKGFPAMLSQTTELVKTNKLSLWGEKFNVFQEYENRMRNINFDRMGFLGRLLQRSSFFFISTMGDRRAQYRLSLALANHYKMLDNNGKECTLYDAFEVKYIDPNHKNYGAKLVIKKGYTKTNGEAFTDADIRRFTEVQNELYKVLFGVYNYADRCAWQSTMIGKMVLMFRTWMVPQFNRRFKSAQYNNILETTIEGYYNTMGRFIWDSMKEIKAFRFAFKSQWNKLDEGEKQNIRRATYELGVVILLSAAIKALFGGGPDRNKKKELLGGTDERTWGSYMLEYQLRRLYIELSALCPTPNLLASGLKMVKEPSATVDVMTDILNLTKLLTIPEWTTIVKSGKYKGKSYAHRDFWESPLGLFYKNVYRSVNPETLISYLKNGF
jgi:hypothetical protein